ncbi:ankyrin repeat and SOCS box protein 15 isoform X2 [Brachyhypopomus gauderio]|uniref:ankyrin repeat and SOCS box protein 15 isoform X2 n=1 Tax=Brachyhypopomus gauderio TaxID=698409 RepID=UPI0040420E69
MDTTDDEDDQLLAYAIQLSIQQTSSKDFPASVENQKILDAIKRGDLFTLEEMLDYPAAFTEVDDQASYRLSLDEETTDGETPLTLATQAGLVEIVQTLLAHGASPHRTNRKNESPLLLAVRTDAYDIALALLRRGALVNQVCLKRWTAMHEAAKVGCIDVLKLLLQHGGEVSVTDQSGVTPMGVAAEFAQAEVLDILIHNGGDVNAQAPNGDSVLYDAAGAGNPDCIDLLLQNGANPNIANLSSQLPIHRAAFDGHYLYEDTRCSKACYMVMILFGRTIILRRKQIRWLNFTPRALRMLIPVTTRRALRLSGQSPVHSAADGGHIQCLTLLLDKGFDVNALLEQHISENYSDMRKTALFFAVSNGDVTCTELLLSAGAKPDLDPLSSLLVAVRAGRYEIVKLLLAKQADMNSYFTVVSDTVFPTALQYCLKDEMMMRMVLNSSYDADKCFSCHHDSTGSNRSHRSDTPNEKIPFCDFISVSWLVQYAGRTVRVLLDYVGYVPLCSKLKMVLEKHKEWPEISDILGNPRLLKHMCRLVIRRHMTPKRLGDPGIFSSAPFPPGLKNYLMYKEYDLYGRNMYMDE